MLEKVNNKIIIVIIIVVLIIGGIYYLIRSNKEEEFIDDFSNEQNIIDQNVEENTKIEKNEIVIDISGEVINPGVIKLEEGSRIIDAIQMAGGVTNNANLSKVNLAYLLEDAQKIYIPNKNEETSEYVTKENADSVISSSNKDKVSNNEKLMVNINTANESDLEKLPGIGPSIAIKIVNYRKENGKFSTIEDIKNVSGIGNSKFNNIKEYIYVK